MEVVGGGGRGALPRLASALGVTSLQRFPVEAEDVLRGSLGRGQALLELEVERPVGAGATLLPALTPSGSQRSQTSCLPRGEAGGEGRISRASLPHFTGSLSEGKRVKEKVWASGGRLVQLQDCGPRDQAS